MWSSWSGVFAQHHYTSIVCGGGGGVGGGFHIVLCGPFGESKQRSFEEVEHLSLELKLYLLGSMF